MNKKKTARAGIILGVLLTVIISPVFAAGVQQAERRNGETMSPETRYSVNMNRGSRNWGNMNRENMNPGNAQSSWNGGLYMLDELPIQEIDNGELEGLLLMREEEKLARDIYQYLGETWGMPIFFNISASEQTHTNAVKALLNRYDIQDPMGNDIPGQFEDPALQALYDELTQQGSESLQSALAVGAAVEDLDIKDLNDLLADTDNEDISVVYENLRRGSENHIRSFVRQLEAMGAAYEAQHISSDELTAILQ